MMNVLLKGMNTGLRVIGSIRVSVSFFPEMAIAQQLSTRIVLRAYGLICDIGLSSLT